ncbi:MAG: nucleotidyltransferase family protein [Steroidobacteraceae bacterium]|jgi:molybdenum cofactor cytidylyltransferase
MIPTNAAGPALRIVVLSAGFSVRLGRPKALTRIRGVTLLQRTVRTLAPLTTGRVIVVLPPRASRARAELRSQRVDFAESRQRVRGLSASVKCGLLRARYSAGVLLLPVDLAWLERGEIARLIGRWRSSRRAVVARRVGRRAGTPLILPRHLYPEALRVAGDLGLRELANGLPRDELKLLDLPSADLDVDTPADLRRARRRRADRGFNPP